MNSVIKGASYVLAHTPQMVVYNGTTQTTERIVNPESEYLKELESHLRSYEECVNYWPNQVYIGNATPEDLAEWALPFSGSFPFQRTDCPSDSCSGNAGIRPGRDFDPGAICPAGRLLF